MKRVDEKNEMKNSIDTSESVDNDDDYGYTVEDIITINHDIMNTTTNKRRRNNGLDDDDDDDDTFSVVVDDDCDDNEYI